MKTICQYRDFVFTITFSNEHPEWVVEFADFSEIITAGETIVEAFQNACEALDLHLESLLKLGKQMPLPHKKFEIVEV